jgi:hypothetical protein
MYEPSNGPTYPAPPNWDGFDLNGPQGGKNGTIPHWWIDAEYLMWFAKSANYGVPLVTTSSPNDAGVIGAPSTQIQYGNGSLSYGMLSGFRFSAGTWFDADGRCGMDAEFFSIGTRGKSFALSSNSTGSPVLARPFINDQNGVPGAYVVASPNYANGSIFNSTSTSTDGGDMNLLINLYRSAPDSGFGYGLSAIIGFRYFELSENVAIASVSSLLSGNTVTFQNRSFMAESGVVSTDIPYEPPGKNLNKLFQYTTTSVQNNTVVINELDQIHTRNDFYGGNFGLYQQFNSGRWSVGVGTSIGVGEMIQSVDVSGGSTLNYNQNETTTTTITKGILAPVVRFSSTSTTSAAVNLSSIGGLYNQTNSIGNYQRPVFDVIPEVNLKLAYAFTPAVTGYIGFNALYANSVVRAPNDVTGFVNPALQPTSSTYGSPSVIHPFNAFASTDYWLMGLNFGINFRY